MDQDTKDLIEEAHGIYEPIVVGRGCRIQNGMKLWQQFQAAVNRCEQGFNGGERQLGERVNELVTVKLLADDPNIKGAISYEPGILPSERKIDFVVEREEDNLYVEVKTVAPNAPDNAETWEKYQQLQCYHPENANFIVQEAWMGGMIYGNTFASRSKFLDYTLAFEDRLEEAQGVRPGPGVLVFCGTGFHWNVTDLEDFADFYHSGRHRADDPFALMEEHEIKKRGLAFRQNVTHFAFLKRRSPEAKMHRCHFPVRGPKLGR